MNEADDKTRDDVRRFASDQLRSLKHLDHKILAGLEGVGGTIAAGNMGAISAAITSFSGFTRETGKKAEEFPFDATGIRFVQRYLDLRVKPRIMRWDDEVELKIARVRKDSGIATSSVDEIEFFDQLLYATGLFYGQCLAQALGGRWVEGKSPGWPVVNLADQLKINPFSKPRKYCRFGKEDDLVGFLKACENQKVNAALIKSMMPKLKLAGFDEGRDTYQILSDQDGQLVGVRIRKPGESSGLLVKPDPDDPNGYTLH
jgi:hypothetical protein